MAKRKAGHSGDDAGPVVRRQSSRRKTSKEDEKTTNSNAARLDHTAEEKKPTKARKRGAAKTMAGKEAVENDLKPAINHEQTSSHTTDGPSEPHRYWLMKAEPESRIERGHDIKFSIDDLASKREPEPWDGIRAFPARNNLRAMKKGDLAFFYHSSCKVPAVVGIMEIVKENSPDLSAQDPNAPYYDPKDTDVENPKWSLVHVEFRRKLKEPITLKELREFAGKGQPLENMHMLKQSRLSVSAVSKQEWDFLIGVIAEREREGSP